MENVTKALLEEAVAGIFAESTIGPHVDSTVEIDHAGNNISVTPERSKEKEAAETGLQPEEGFNRSSFGLSSNAFEHALKKIVKDELDKLLSSKDKKDKKPKINI